MSTATSTLNGTTVRGIRRALTFSGVVMLLVGLLIFVWPEHSAVALAWVLAVYAVIVGLVYLVTSVSAKTLGGWRRVGNAVVGLLFIAVGVLAFVNLAVAATVFVTFAGVYFGIVWILEGVLSIAAPGNETARSWGVLFGVLSVIAGILLLFSPMWGGLVLWGLFGIWLVVLGILQITRGARFDVDEA